MIVRDARPGDAEAMTAILNRIIAIGGTTAHDTPKTAGKVLEDYVAGPDVLSSVVVEGAGAVIGWQSVGWWRGDPHIGSFVDPGGQAKGAGVAMFGLTCDRLRALGLRHVMASIRADNLPGLAYYARIGFVDVGQDPGFALSDGRVVGRVHRRFDLV
ncbi:GNAT family N-acetyltransferase [Rhodobacter sp. SY28-1]|uniref:GNAT family N-acetyltransferase n=1 Tax=Rhodobacter sp. SY28-1 TaxID=2562317 RepID=UPI0010C0776B|nr:GNAT family N-acetyltransferase [Rhodobacter sp. SY28-1]